MTLYLKGLQSYRPSNLEPRQKFAVQSARVQQEWDFVLKSLVSRLPGFDSRPVQTSSKFDGLQFCSPLSYRLL